jgi:Helix-turn-helix domain
MTKQKAKAKPKPKTKLMPDDLPTLDVPEAGRRYFGLSRGGSYDAAKRGDLPVVRIGRRLRVPIVALERMMNVEPKRQEDAA